MPANYLAPLCSLEDPACWTHRGSACLMSDGLVPPLSGAGIWLVLQVPIWRIEHKHLLGFWLAWGGLQSGDREREREKRGGNSGKGSRRQPFWGEFISYCVIGALSSLPSQEGKGKREEFSRGFGGKPKVQSVDVSPSLLWFSQLFLFSPVGYYFLTHFDNYFINQER